MPGLRSAGAHVKEWLKGQIVESISYAHAEGVDKEEIRDWKWPGYTILRRTNGTSRIGDTSTA